MIGRLKKKRMPHLVVDEVLLLVDTYFQIKSSLSVSEEKQMITELSNNMRNLPFFIDEVINPEFRSFAGMKMCIANVGYIDPDSKSKFGHGSALQKKIFQYYSNRQYDLRKLALAIVNISREVFPIDYSFENSTIGILVPSYHVYMERTCGMVLEVKNQLKLYNDTICKVCGRDMSDIYKDGKNMIEVHLDIPLYKNTKYATISPSVIIGLCPSCHKLAHMEYDNFEVKNLRKGLKE